MSYILLIRMLPVRSYNLLFLHNEEYFCIIRACHAMGYRKVYGKYIDKIPQFKIVLIELKISEIFQSVFLYRF